MGNNYTNKNYNNNTDSHSLSNNNSTKNIISKKLGAIIKVQKAYRKLVQKRQNFINLQEKMIKIKNIELNDNIKYSFINKKNLKNMFGKEYFDFILNNISINYSYNYIDNNIEFETSNNLSNKFINSLKDDISCVYNEYSYCGKNIFLNIFKPEFPIQINNDIDVSSYIYDGCWNLNKDMCGYGIIYIKSDISKNINNSNIELFKLDYNMYNNISNMNHYTDNYSKAVSAVFLNNKLISKFARIFYLNHMIYEGEIKPIYKNNLLVDIIPNGKGTLYTYLKPFFAKDLVKNKVEFSIVNKTRVLLLVKGDFYSDFLINNNSITDYVYNDIIINSSSINNKNILNNKLNIFYKDMTIFNGFIKSSVDNNINTLNCLNFELVSGIIKFSNENIYQGKFSNNKFDGFGVYFENKNNYNKNLSINNNSRIKFDNNSLKENNCYDYKDIKESFLTLHSNTSKIKYNEKSDNANDNSNEKTISKKMCKKIEINKNSLNYNERLENIKDKYKESINLLNLNNLKISKFKLQYLDDYFKLFDLNSLLLNYDRYININLKVINKFEEVSCSNVLKLYNNCMIWGDGKYYFSNFKNGKLNGKGFVFTDNNLATVIWRYGKIITIEQTIKENRKLPNLIFEFLTVEEKFNLSKTLKNKTFFSVLKNNTENYFYFKINQLINILHMFYNKTDNSLANHMYAKKVLDSIDITNSSFIKVLNFNVSLNLINFILEYLLNYYSYIPIAPFKTNNGIYNKDTHYSNIFLPSLEYSYFSSFYFNKNNISIGCAIDNNNYNNIDLLNYNSQGIESKVINAFNKLNENNYLLECNLVDLLEMFKETKFDSQFNRNKFLNQLYCNKNYNLFAKNLTKWIIFKFDVNNYIINKDFIKLNTKKPIKFNSNLNKNIKCVSTIVNSDDNLLNYEKNVKEFFNDINICNNNYYLIKENYIVDYENPLIVDKAILNKNLYINNSFAKSFYIEYLYINNSTKPNSMTVLHNPVKFLALFISDKEILLKEETDIMNKLEVNYKEIEYQDLLNKYTNEDKFNNFNIEKDIIINKLSELGLIINKLQENQDFSVIEFNSQFKKTKDNNILEYNSSSSRLLAIIQLKQPKEHLIKLSKFSHPCKYINLKLINSYSYYGSGGHTIDLVSMLCFGRQV